MGPRHRLEAKSLGWPPQSYLGFAKLFALPLQSLTWNICIYMYTYRPLSTSQLPSQPLVAPIPQGGAVSLTHFPIENSENTEFQRSMPAWWLLSTPWDCMLGPQCQGGHSLRATVVLLVGIEIATQKTKRELHSLRDTSDVQPATRAKS